MNKKSRQFIQKIIDNKKHDGFDVETLVRSRETKYLLGIPCTVDTLSVISKNSKEYNFEKYVSNYGQVDGVFELVCNSKFPIELEYDRVYKISDLLEE